MKKYFDESDIRFFKIVAGTTVIVTVLSWLFL